MTKLLMNLIFSLVVQIAQTPDVVEKIQGRRSPSVRPSPVESGRPRGPTVFRALEKRTRGTLVRAVRRVDFPGKLGKRHCRPVSGTASDVLYSCVFSV